MTDVELNDAIGFFRKDGPEWGGWAATAKALEELRSWRLVRPLLERMFGEFRGGAAGHDPEVTLDGLVELGLMGTVPYNETVHSDPHDFEMEAGDPHYVLAPVIVALLDEGAEK